MEGDVSPCVPMSPCVPKLSALERPRAGRWSSGGSSTFGVLWRKLLLPCGVSRSLSSSPAPCCPHNPPAGPQESSWLCPGVGTQGRDMVHIHNWLFFFSPAPISCQLRRVKLICSPASLPALKPPLGSPSLSLSLVFDVPDRHMVAGLSPWLLVHHCYPPWQPFLGDTGFTG